MLPDIAVVTSRERLGPWLERLGRDGALAVDTETSGLNAQIDLVGGLCLSAGRTCLYAARNALGPAVLWLADQVKQQRELIFHHAKLDLKMLETSFNLRVPYPVHDTKTISFLYNNLGFNGGHHLKDIAKALVDSRAADPQTTLLASIKEGGGKKGEVLWSEDLRLIGEYGALDAWWTLQAWPILLGKLSATAPIADGKATLLDLYENERWLVLALRDMELRGVRVNIDFLVQWREQLEKDIAKTERQLVKVAGKEILWTSSDQLSTLLYEHLGIPVTRWTKGGKKSGPKPSTDEVALTKINHPIGPLLLRWRDLSKQHSTYAIGLLESISPDGRIHATFNPDGARTGRLSCKDPNMQQIPRWSGARRAFIPDEELAFYFGDYSQVEMRFAAIESHDPTLIEGFRNNPLFDTHAATAMKMWGMQEIDPDGNKLHGRRRKFAKIMNFAMLFGAGEDKVTSQLVSLLTSKEAIASIREFGRKLDRKLIPHRQLAQLLMERYFTEFQAIKKARYAATREAKQNGYVTNLFGRRRYFDHNTEYKAFNTKIQGAAADQAKRGLVSLYRELQGEGRIALILQIHDEAVYLSDDDPSTHARVLEILNDTSSFEVPIVANLDIGKDSWQEKTRYVP